MTPKSANSISLAIHGGAGGTLANARKSEKTVREAMHGILKQGYALLDKGGSALDAVTLCVRLLEDCPLFNAGRGAVANNEGNYELDAAIMDGRTRKAGAIASATNIRNPIELARLVMEKTPHVMLSGKGANDFAKAQGVARVTRRYFEEAERAVKVDKSGQHGTVGAVARDRKGNLAAATSTGGWKAKMPGRIGDSPIVGAGTFASNSGGAVSCTGSGEHFIRTTLAAHVAFLIEEKGMSAEQAAQAEIERLVELVNGEGAFILIDPAGTIAVAQSSIVMRAGWVGDDGVIHTTIQAPIRVARQS